MVIVNYRDVKHVMPSGRMTVNHATVRMAMQYKRFAPDVLLFDAENEPHDTPRLVRATRLLRSDEVVRGPVRAVLLKPEERPRTFYVAAALSHARAYDAEGVSKIAKCLRRRTRSNDTRSTRSPSFSSDLGDADEPQAPYSDKRVLAESMTLYVANARAVADAAVLRILLDARAEVNYSGGPAKATALLLAVKAHASVEVAQCLIDAKASTNDHVDRCLRSPLHLAAMRGCEEMAATLLAAQADVTATDQRGMNWLAIALEASHVKMVERLISSGTDCHFANPSGDTLYSFATRHEYGAILDIVSECAPEGEGC